MEALITNMLVLFNLALSVVNMFLTAKLTGRILKSMCHGTAKEEVKFIGYILALLFGGIFGFSLLNGGLTIYNILTGNDSEIAKHIAELTIDFAVFISTLVFLRVQPAIIEESRVGDKQEKEDN